MYLHRNKFVPVGFGFRYYMAQISLFLTTSLLIDPALFSSFKVSSSTDFSQQ